MTHQPSSTDLPYAINRDRKGHAYSITCTVCRKADTIDSRVILDDETAAQGGAISAEHGIGITNRGRLARVADPFDIELMRGIKQLLDPNGLMNPDKIFASERRVTESAGAA